MSHKKNKIPSINPYLSTHSHRKKAVDITLLFDGIKSGDWKSLSQAITLIESKNSTDQSLAQELIRLCLPLSGQSFRIGITGSPGVGKSTFIESIGMQLIEEGHQVAVLAIDPSSRINHGSILGDKTRMDRLSTHEKSFIRPSPAGETLGGVARTTRESIILCEAAGFDRILVETVGVGQSETAVHSMTDFFLLLLLPGSGDELQGIKRGVMEMADLVLVNKADGDRIDLAKKTQMAVQNALHILPPKHKEWNTQVKTISALKLNNIDVVIQLANQYLNWSQRNEIFDARRKGQSSYWLDEYINFQLKNTFFKSPGIQEKYEAIHLKVKDNTISPFDAVDELFRMFLKQKL